MTRRASDHHVQLGIPTDFVKKSKLERELIQLDKDLAPRKERLTKQATDYEGMVSKARVRRESQNHAWMSVGSPLSPPH